MPPRSIYYQRRSYFTGQWSAVHEYASSGFQKPTLAGVQSGNLFMVWTDGENVFRAKYTQSSNSWSFLPPWPAATDPQVATTGGSSLAAQTRHNYRTTASAPYSIATAASLVMQQAARESGFLPETYARRISVVDTTTGASFMVEFEYPKIRNSRGELHDLPFVATNDTLLNLSLDSLGAYLRTEDSALASDADSLILPFRVDSRSAESMGKSSAGGLKAVCRLETPGHPNSSQEVTLHQFGSRAKRSARARMSVRALRGRPARIELKLRGLNRRKSGLVPVLTHVHYFGAPGTPNEIVEVDAVAFGQNLQEPDTALPQAFALHQNYPNPFNPTTVIRYDVPERAQVRIQLFNIKGQLVKMLVEKHQEAGQHKVVWDGRDDLGLPVAAGTYFYRMDAGHFEDVKRLLLLK